MTVQNSRQQAARLTILLGLIALPFAAFAQSSGTDIPRLRDGKPDLQGIWDFRTITPFQRPEALGNQATLTAEEAVQFEIEERERRDRDNFTDTSTTGDYNEFWYDRGKEILGDRRTSLVTDPPNGRIPALTAAAEARNKMRQEQAAVAAGVEVRPLSERCIMGFNSGPPMLPSAYNNNVQIVQTADHVMLHNEMVHNMRPVKMTAASHRESPRKWEGDSVGHWDGDVLVVETKHFARDTAFGNSSENMHLIEKFWLIDADTLGYEFTITDPTTWTAPWTAMFPMVRSEEPMYEYACHEGNYAMAGILGGWRRLEALGQSGQQ